MAFSGKQSLNDWVVMLHALYGDSQNYGKTAYEIHAHLTEVCGLFGKFAFKKKDYQKAEEFLPKIFAWAIALFKKMHPDGGSLEDIVLRKCPTVCAYCLNRPCKCWAGEKPSIDEGKLRAAFYSKSAGMRRTVNDFQLMFREIYEVSWKFEGQNLSEEERLRRIYIRLIEELSEVAETVRFHHLYPQNFGNELTDFLAWWFALITCIPLKDGEEALLAEARLWRAYPGHCLDCQLLPCLCRPGPVRQLMSRPIPGFDHRFDSLTSLHNQAAYKEDIRSAANKELVLTAPITCVRLDVDKFKAVNDSYGHAAGDEALRHIAGVLTKVARERDRIYRISGDEFGLLCANYTEEEASGAMRRVSIALERTPVRWIDRNGKVSEFCVSVSIGVAETQDGAGLESAYELADKAAYKSKQSGKGVVSKASTLAPAS